MNIETNLNNQTSLNMKKLDRLTRLQGRIGRIITNVGAGMFFLSLGIILTIHFNFDWDFGVAPSAAVLPPVLFAAFGGIRKKR